MVESISEIYYLAGNKGWIWQVVMITSGVALLPFWLEATPNELQFLPFMSCGGVMSVGCAPCFRLKLQGWIHYSAAVVCCLSAVAWMLLMGCWAIFAWCFIGALLLTLLYPRSYMLWIELGVLLSLMVSFNV
jgi:hypothetical protein